MNEVLYVTRMVPHYRYAALRRLNERLGGRLVVCAGTPPRTSSLKTLTRATPHGYPTLPIRNVWIGGETLHIQPFGRIFRAYPAPSVVIAEESIRSVTLPLLLRRARQAGAARLTWGHFSSNRRPFSRRSPTTCYRLALARSVEGCICYSEPIADLLRPHIDPSRIFVAPNTLDTCTLLALYEKLQRTGRAGIRRRLKLDIGCPVFVFLGRLIKAKGTTMLLDTFEILRRRHPNSTLVVIGDGPEHTIMKTRAGRIGGVRMLGTVTDWSASAPFLYAADLLLNPGYLGLSINHAFSLGLPIVSQESPSPSIRYHSPEIAYLLPEENGLLAPYGNAEAMADAVDHVLANRDRYAHNALEFARANLGLDVMVDGLARAVSFAESPQARRRGLLRSSRVKGEQRPLHGHAEANKLEV